jgi:ArsR family transcriptional regulator
VQDLLSIFRALGDETRLRLLRILQHGSFHVNELVAILGSGQSRVSRHLKALLDSGLVVTRRQGSWVWYDLSAQWREAKGGTNRILEAVSSAMGAESSLGDLDREGIEACLTRRRERAEGFFRSAAADWDQRRDRLQGPQSHLETVASVLGRARTVVDLGTGTGILLTRLSTVAERVIGVDASAEMLDVARRTLQERRIANVELRLGRLEHLPLLDGEADAMVANMVLHHVPRPPEALREMRRGLAPGGRLVLADLQQHGEESYRSELGDLWLGFERAELESWLEAAEFDVESCVESCVEPADRSGATGAPRPGVLVIAARRRDGGGGTGMGAGGQAASRQPPATGESTVDSRQSTVEEAEPPAASLSGTAAGVGAGTGAGTE